MKKSFKGAGRPVLVSCKAEYATCANQNLMIIIPKVSGFGAATYFRGEPKMSHSVFCLEYDGCFCKYQYDEFIQANDTLLLEHLQSPLVDEEFKAKAVELIKECPLEL